MPWGPGLSTGAGPFVLWDAARHSCGPFRQQAVRQFMQATVKEMPHTRQLHQARGASVQLAPPAHASRGNHLVSIALYD